MENMDYEELLELGERIGTVAPPSAPSAAAAVAATVVSTLDAAEVARRAAAGGDEMKCVICLEEFAVGDVVRTLTACPHSCHALCLERWLETRPACPVCGTAATRA